MCQSVSVLGLQEEDAAVRVVSRTSGDRMLLMTVGDAISGKASRIIQAAETAFQVSKEQNRGSNCVR